MEITISETCKDYFYEKLLQNFFDKFIKMNPESTKTKYYSPILITCQNSYLSNLFIEKILNYIFPNEKLITSNYEHKLLNNKNIAFNVKMSKNHIEVNPSEYGINDRNIVGEYIEEISNAPNIITGNKKNIIVWNIDKLGVIAFDSLHYVIKKNEDHANFICISSNSNKIDKSILSILNEINISNPDKQFYSLFFEKFYPNIDKVNILNELKLGLNDYNFNSFLKYVGVMSNFKKELAYKNPLKNFIRNIYEKIILKNKISDSFIEELRTILYDLYVYHFTYDEVVYVFIDLIANDATISDEKKRLILKKACLYGNTSNKGNKQVIHLEAFIYNFMNIYHSAAKA
jgi:replication factor C subunit 3/5